MTRSFRLTTALLLVPFAPVALADTVHLKNGGVIEGEVEPAGKDRVRVRNRFGTIELKKAEIERIGDEPSQEERFEALRAKTDADDPEALERLAQWCREQGMSSRGRDLDARAARLREQKAEERRAAEAAARRAQAEAEAARRAARLSERRLALAAGDADGLYALAMWAEGEGYAAADVERLLREALLADPQKAAPRVALELRKQEAEARAAREAAAAARKAAEGELERARAERAEAEALRARMAAREVQLAASLEAAAASERQARGELEQARRDAQKAAFERQEAARERQAIQEQLYALERERAALAHQLERVRCEHREVERLRCALQAQLQAAQNGGKGTVIPTGVSLCRRCGHTTR